MPYPLLRSHISEEPLVHFWPSFALGLCGMELLSLSPAAPILRGAGWQDNWIIAFWHMHHIVPNWVTSVFLPMEISASSERDGKLYLSPSPRHFRHLNASSEWRRCHYNCNAQWAGGLYMPHKELNTWAFNGKECRSFSPAFLDMCSAEKKFCGIDTLMFDLFSSRHTHMSSSIVPKDFSRGTMALNWESPCGVVKNLMYTFWAKIRAGLRMLLLMIILNKPSYLCFIGLILNGWVQKYSWSESWIFSPPEDFYMNSSFFFFNIYFIFIYLFLRKKKGKENIKIQIINNK